MLFFAQGLVYFGTDIYTDVLYCVQCISFVPHPYIFVMFVILIVSWHGLNTGSSFYMATLDCHFQLLLHHMWAISWVGYINPMNELTASDNLKSDKIVTLYFMGVLSLLNIVLTYRHETLVRCVVIIATVAAVMTSCIWSEDICTSCFFHLHRVWIVLHKHYTCYSILLTLQYISPITICFHCIDIVQQRNNANCKE